MNTPQTRNMDKVFTHGQMADFMKEDFIMVNNMERVCIDKQMDKTFTGSG